MITEIKFQKNKIENSDKDQINLKQTEEFLDKNEENNQKDFLNLLDKKSENILSELKTEELQFQKEINDYSKFSNSIYDFNLNKIYFHPKIDVNDRFDCFSLRFDKTDSFIASGYSNGYVAVLNLQTESYKLMKTGDFPVTSVRWNPNPATKSKNIVVSVTADGQIIHWHASSGRPLHTMVEKDNPIMCVEYSHDGSLFATAGSDKLVRIYEDSTKTLLSTMSTSFTQPGHSNRIFALNFHKENTNLLISGGWDNTIQFYDVRQKSVVSSFYGPHICGDSIDTKGNYLLTGSWSVKDQIQIWDIRTNKCFIKVPWEDGKIIYPSYIYTSQFSKCNQNDLFAVGGSNQNTLRIFENESLEKSPQLGINSLETPCYSLDFSNNGKRLAYGCGDGHIRVMNVKKNK